MAKRDADQLQNKWVEQLAFAQAQTYGTLTAAQLHQLRHQEIACREVRACRVVLHRTRTQSLEIVVAPDSTGRWRECTLHDQIESAHLQENASRFQQAASTPFLKPPLASLIDLFRSNQAAQSVLTDQFQTPPNVDNETRTLITALGYTNGHPPLQCHTALTLEEYMWQWHQAHESTATGYLLLHFGHFKASVTHNIIGEFECRKF